MFSLDSKANLEEVNKDKDTESEENIEEGNKETAESGVSDGQLQLDGRKHKSRDDVTTPHKSKTGLEKSKRDAKIAAANTQAAAIFNQQQINEACLKCAQLSTELKSKEEELQREKVRAKADLMSKEEEIQKAEEREMEYKEQIDDLTSSVNAKKLVIDNLQTENAIKRSKGSSKLIVDLKKKT